jgi:uncharacterized protein (TIGR00730 family)
MTKVKTNNDHKSMIRRLKQSSAYRIAFYDNDFLGEAHMRPARLMIELEKPEFVFRKNKIVSTIVVFGGTRLDEPSVSKARVDALDLQVKKNPRHAGLKTRLRIAKSILAKSKYYEEARDFARIVSTECQMHNDSQYVIVTGGGPGIMEAANRGAWDVGAKSIGLNITLPMEQEPNAYISPELCLQFHYFAIRKMHFLLRAKALLAFPGGYGTLDELFEALTLVQTKKVPKLPIILFGKKYWSKLINFDALVSEGTIDADDLKLFTYCDKAAEAWTYIKQFYANRNGKNGNGSK